MIALEFNSTTSSTTKQLLDRLLSIRFDSQSTGHGHPMQQLMNQVLYNPNLVSSLGMNIGYVIGTGVKGASSVPNWLLEVGPN